MGIETAILASTAATAGGTAAATAGIFGTGITLSSISTGLSILQGVSGLVGGFQSSNEADNQSALAIQQANARGVEQVRQSEREARFEQERVDDKIRRQKISFMKSGVTLEGSPLLVMEETRRRGKENVDEILRGGEAAQRAAQAEGRLHADQLQATGRQAFNKGITSAAGTLAPILGGLDG